MKIKNRIKEKDEHSQKLFWKNHEICARKMKNRSGKRKNNENS